MNSIGETPLHYAVQAADEELVKLLLKYKADMSIVSKKSGSVLDNANDNIKRILTNLSGGGSPLSFSFFSFIIKYYL